MNKITKILSVAAVSAASAFAADNPAIQCGIEGMEPTACATEIVSPKFSNICLQRQTNYFVC